MEIGRYFLYEEKVVPYYLTKDKLNLKWRIFGNWFPSCCGEDFSKEIFMRIKGNTIWHLAEKFSQNEEVRNKKKIVIFSNPDYKASFVFEGSHSDIYRVFQRGVNEKVRKNFIKALHRSRIYNAEDCEAGIALSRLTRKEVFDFIE